MRGMAVKRARKKRASGEGTVRQRRDGSWEARLPAPSSKSFYAKTQKEALAKLNKARLYYTELAFDAEKLTFGEYLYRWLNDSVRGSVKEQTHDAYESKVRLHLVPTLGRVKLTKLTAAHLQGLYRQKLDEGLKPKTIGYIHTVANRALRQAVKWQLIPGNPAEHTDPPRGEDVEIDPLPAETISALLNAARGHRLEALVVVGVFTGLRIGELAGLRWSDVDLENSTLRVRQQVIRPNSGARIDTLKSKAARRSVYLPPQAVEAFRKHRLRQSEEKLRAGPLWENTGLIFTNHKGELLDTSHVSGRVLRPLLKRAGVDIKGVRFHDLRHTFATLSAMNGEHPQVVQRALGHSTMNQTMKIYTHVLPEMQKDAARRLGEMF